MKCSAYSAGIAASNPGSIYCASIAALRSRNALASRIAFPTAIAALVAGPVTLLSFAGNDPSLLTTCGMTQRLPLPFQRRP